MRSSTSLALLLQVRAISERLARRGVAEAAAVQAAADQHVEELEESLASLGLPREARTPEWVAAQASARSMASLVVVAREQAAVAAAQTAAARAAWAEREKERESIAQMAARVAEQERVERARLDQRETDDLVTSRHGRRDDTTEPAPSGADA
ncbi:MAG: flagellar FliJ family protein [Candidatus Nanopelagicales bacterium]